jgi:hypothetical protein
MRRRRRVTPRRWRVAPVRGRRRAPMRVRR